MKNISGSVAISLVLFKLTLNLQEHPELDVIIYEFMREVLHRRPNDFNAFAADWFANPKLKSHIDARIAQGNPPRDLGLDQNYGSI